MNQKGNLNEISVKCLNMHALMSQPLETTSGYFSCDRSCGMER